MNMEKESLTLSRLNLLIKQTLYRQFPDEIWLQAETSDVRCANNGHCYLEFIEKDEQSRTIIARARGMIWNNTFRQLKSYFEQETGQAFVSGIKVLVRVRIDFNEIYGFGLVVTSIDPTYTIGDMVRRRKEILLRLKADGVLTMNKELPLPELPKRVAVISSASAAGFGDFSDQLHHNPSGFAFTTRLFPAIMQGEQVEASIIAALDKIHDELDNWDLVVIIRGGGATSDLAGFDTYPLAASVAQFPLPIITGIGHERDDTVLDLIAHTRVKTPTAAAEFLISKMDLAEQRLLTAIQKITSLPGLILEREQNRINNLAKRIPQVVVQHIGRQEKLLLSVNSLLKYQWATRLQRELHKLDLHPRLANAAFRKIEKEKSKIELLIHRTESLSPNNILKRGYSLTLKNGKTIRSITELQPGDLLETRFEDGSITSQVQ